MTVPRLCNGGGILPLSSLHPTHPTRSPSSFFLRPRFPRLPAASSSTVRLPCVIPVASLPSFLSPPSSSAAPVIEPTSEGSRAADAEGGRSFLTGGEVRHANLRVRAKAAVAMSHCASRMDMGTMKEFGMAALLQVAAKLLSDRLPEAREAARGMVSAVPATFSKEVVAKAEESAVAASWESFCSLSLLPMAAQSVAKIVSPS